MLRDADVAATADHRRDPDDAADVPASEPRGGARRLSRLAQPHVALPLATAVVLGVIYRLTLLPGPGVHGDTAKFQFIGRVLGIPHATGYPTYTAVNALWVRLLPVGNDALRANLLSAACAIGAALLLVATLRRLGVRPLVACCVALAFAVTPTLWLHAVIAEVYTLHLLFMATVSYCLVRWSLEGSNHLLLAGMAAFALSFGNHMTTAMAVPAVAFLVLSHARRALTPRNVAVVAAMAVAGAAQYALLILRTRQGAPYLELSPSGLRGLFDVVTGAQHKQAMFAFSPGQLVRERIPWFLDLARDETALLLLPAGLAALARGVPLRVAGFFGLFAAGNLAYALNYDIPDIHPYFIPVYMVVAVAAGVGAERAVQLLSRWTAGGVAALVLVLALPTLMVARSYDHIDQSGNVEDARAFAAAVADAPDRSILLSGDYHHSEYLWHHLIGRGIGEQRGIDVFHAFDPGAVAAYLQGGEPLLYTPGRYRFPAPPIDPSNAAPRGLRVFVVKEAMRSELEARGLTVRPYRGVLSEVTA